jgi:hypothetical protein
MFRPHWAIFMHTTNLLELLHRIFNVIEMDYINNVQVPQEEEVEYLGLHLNRRLAWHKHTFAKRNQLGITLTKVYWSLRRKSKFSTSNRFLICKATRTYGRPPIPTFEVEEKSKPFEEGATFLCASKSYSFYYYYC